MILDCRDKAIVARSVGANWIIKGVANRIELADYVQTVKQRVRDEQKGW